MPLSAISLNSLGALSLQYPRSCSASLRTFALRIVRTVARFFTWLCSFFSSQAKETAKSELSKQTAEVRSKTKAKIPKSEHRASEVAGRSLPHCSSQSPAEQGCRLVSGARVETGVPAR